MTKLKKALFDTFGVELEGYEKITFNHCYCGSHVADVIIEDIRVNKTFTFPAYDMEKGCFPY